MPDIPDNFRVKNVCATKQSNYRDHAFVNETRNICNIDAGIIGLFFIDPELIDASGYIIAFYFFTYVIV